MAKAKAKAKAKATAKPAPTLVTAKTITKAQIAELKRLSVEAGDDAMLVEIRTLYDKKSSAAAKRRALTFCVELHNALLTM
jgi:hypothetical protein